MPTVTMRDVADYVGVSRATVSRVLNDNPSVAADIRGRVLEAVRELGYQPNRAARRLRAHSSDVLGVVVSDIQNPFFTYVVRGVEDAAYAHEMTVLLCNTDENPAKQSMYLRVMQAERVAGLIISPTKISDGRVLNELREAGMPVVLADRYVEDFAFDEVKTDNVRGAVLAVNHLIALGHRRIALIGVSRDLATGYERYQGYRNALVAAGLPFDEALVKVSQFSIESGYRMTGELMALPDPPQAIFAVNYMLTIGALRALRAAGLRVPEDVALVGFDDVAWADELCPPLTVISQPAYEIGQEAVGLLLRRLAAPDAPFRAVTLQPRLIVRQSCGAALQEEGR